MGLRGVIKDVVVFYLCYKIFKVWLLEAPFTSDIGWSALILFLLALWFMFERVGILPKL